MNELNRLIGTLVEGMGGVKADLKSMREEMRESERASASSRAGMHRRLDEVVQRTGELERDMTSMSSTVKDVKAVTDKVTMWEQRGIGAIAITGIGASAITFALTHYFNEIVRFLTKS